MSQHHPHETEKQEKKRKQREKNRRDWIIFQQSALLRENVDIGTPSSREHGHRDHKPQGRAENAPKLWSEKLNTIRNRLDNSRRLSDDRWNRFAGTADGGGRGR